MDIGSLRHRVTLSNPGTDTPDGDGGYSTVAANLTPPQLWAEIKPATARDLERVVAGTVQSNATHVIRTRFHPGVTTKTQILFNGRTFAVTGVQNIDERNVELVIVAVEVVD